MAVDSQGRYVVAWVDGTSGTDQIYLRRWDGIEWKQFGFPQSQKRICGRISDTDALPRLHTETSAEGEGISHSQYAAGSPRVAIDRHDNIVVAWLDFNPANLSLNTVRVRKWTDAGGWFDYPDIYPATAAGLGYGARDHVSLALVPFSGQPVVAYVGGGTGFPEIRLKIWRRCDWSGLGGDASSEISYNSDNPTGMSLIAVNVQPSVAVHLNSVANPFLPDLTHFARPVVAWATYDESTAAWQVHLRRWNGSSWKQLDGSGQQAGVSQNNSSAGNQFVPPNVSVALKNDVFGSPVVAWSASDQGFFSDIYAKFWDTGTSSWQPFSGSSSAGRILKTDDAPSLFPSLALDPWTNDPIVAWKEPGGFNESLIYVMRHEESAGWTLLEGAGGAYAGSYADRPSLTVDGDGIPAVAWEESVRDNGYDIYARRLERTHASMRLDPMWQRGSDGGFLDRGGQTAATPVVLGGVLRAGTIGSVGRGRRMRIQVEAHPAGERFTGLASYRGNFGHAGDVSRVVLRQLAAGPWLWRARIEDENGGLSDWQMFGGTDADHPDFIVTVRR